MHELMQMRRSEMGKAVNCERIMRHIIANEKNPIGCCKRPPEAFTATLFVKCGSPIGVLAFPNRMSLIGCFRSHLLCCFEREKYSICDW